MNELEIAISRIDERISMMQNQLGSGDAVEYNQYLTICGIIKGLLTARREITDLKHNLEISDE
jgi:hypothetical protein